MDLNTQEIVDSLCFSYEGRPPITSSEVLLASDLSALNAKDIPEALSIEFKLGGSFLNIGSSVSFYSLPTLKNKKRSSSNFSDAFAYLAVINIDGICHALFIADVLTLADVIRRLESLSAI